jgi:flagellar biosynthesis/type III secretory pathway chaperone
VDHLVIRLIDIIDKEVNTFEQLLDTLQNQQKALVTHKVDEVEAAVGKQVALSDQTSILEKARVLVVQELAETLSVDPKSLTISRMIEFLPVAQAEKLVSMRASLGEIQGKILNTNRHNTLLIKQSLKYVDKTMQILSGGEDSSGAYAQSGKVEVSAASHRTVMNQVV